MLTFNRDLQTFNFLYFGSQGVALTSVAVAMDPRQYPLGRTVTSLALSFTNLDM